MLKIAVFDLDNTFVNYNSTFEFVKFYLYQKSKPRLVYFYFHFYFLRRFSTHFKEYCVTLLKGESRENLRRISKKFSKVLVKGINIQIYDEFRKLRNKGYRLFLVSSSLDFVAKSFAEKVNFNQVFGSSLAFDQRGICLGYFSKDLTGRKDQLLIKMQEKLGRIDFKHSYCFSDNRDDLSLLKLFGNSYAVVNDRLASIYWNNNGIESVFVSPRLVVSERKFVVPLSYYFYARGGEEPLISFILGSYLIFQLITLFFFHSFSQTVNILVFVIGFLNYWNIYEITYLINDCRAFKEKEPTLRIDKRMCDNLAFVTISKLLIFISLDLLLILLRVNIVAFLVWTEITLFISLIHNYSKENSILKILITFPLLRLSHILVPLSLFSINVFYPFLGYSFYLLSQELISYLFKKRKTVIISPLIRFRLIVGPRIIMFLIILMIFALYPSYEFIRYLLLIGFYFMLLDIYFLSRHYKEIFSF